MRREEITVGNEVYVRVNKASARRAWNNGDSVMIAPVNANLRSGWYSGILPVRSLGEDFDAYVNAAEAHYAPEEGRYSMFLLKAY